MTERVTSDTGPFAIVPEWVIDADISNGALRLYAVIGRYTNSSNSAWPSRGTLARRLRTSKDSVDRWTKELVGVNALSVQRRWSEERGSNQSNMYVLRHVRPDMAATMHPPSRKDAATPNRVGAAQNDNQLERQSENVALSPAMDEARELCEYLRTTVGVESVVSNRWLTEMERLVRIDGRSPDQVRRAVDWVAQDDFWGMNVRSPQKLRKHWERLRLEAKRASTGSKPARRAHVLRLIDEMEETA
jgi:hypothetical protein